MADKNISVRTKQKNDTSDRWTLANPVLFSGEIGFSTENGRTKIKVGDGTTRWGSLPYISVNVADIPDFPDLSVYMAAQNPTGTGSFSLNRKAGTGIGTNSVAMGHDCEASGDYSNAAGYKTTALAHQHVVGHYNDTSTATAGEVSEEGNPSGLLPNMTGTAFVIGNGGYVRQNNLIKLSNSNAFRVTYGGDVIGKKAYSTTGADYAELREWADGNPNDEDRRGYFVTLIDDKIKIAEPGDYIEGIISGNPAILGNHDECWMGKNLRDEFGNFIYEDIAVEDEKTGKTSIVKAYKINPDYDPDQPYIPRSERREWSPVGMLGHLSVRDDGTCQPNGYCQVAHGGIAAAADKGYRVVNRISENIVEIVFSIYAQF